MLQSLVGAALLVWFLWLLSSDPPDDDWSPARRGTGGAWRF